MADGIRFWLRLGLLLATFSLLNTASLHRTARNATDKEISKNERLSHIVNAKYETDLEHKNEETKALDEIRTLGSKNVQHENSHKSSGVSLSEESFTPLFDQQTDETKQFRGSTKYFTTFTNLNVSTSTTTESAEQSKLKLETNINLPLIKNEVRNTIQTQNIHKQNVKYELNDDPGIQNKEPNRKFSHIPHINTKNPIKDVNQDKSVKQTNNTTNIELQNSKSNDKSATIAERSETGRSFDIDKYISPEFHNINNVYTQISSAEAERYADPNNYGEIYHSTKPFGKTFSYSVTHDYDTELTTPKSTLFDSKFHQISNDIKYNLDQDENLSETNANRSYNTDKISVESLLTKKSDNDTNISIDFKNKLNITLDEDNIKKGSKRMNVSVENGTVLHFHSDFLKTEIFTELPKQENETNSSLETSNTILDSINTEKSTSSTGKPVDMWTTLKPRIQNHKIEPENSSVESLTNLNDKNELLKKTTLKLKPYVLSTSIPTSIDPLYDNQTVETDKVMKIDKDNRIGINKRGSTKYMNTVTNQPDTVTSESISKPISINTTVTFKDTEKNSSDSFVQENKIFSVQIAPPNNQIKPTTSQYDRILTSNLATDYFEITTYKPKISTETVSDYPTDLPILTESIDELRNENSSSKTVSIVNNNEINVNVTKNSKPLNDFIDSIFPEYAVKKPTENISTTQRPNSSRQNLSIDDLFENIFKSPLITHTQSSTKSVEYSTEFVLSTDKPVTFTDETTTFEQSEFDVTKKIDQKTILSTAIISDIETTVTSSFKLSENTLTERETTEAYTESVSLENSVPSTSQKTTSNTSQVPSTSEKIENIVSSTIKMAKNLHIPKSTTEMEIESTSYTVKNSDDQTTYSHDSSTTLSPEDINYSTSFTLNELSTKPTKVLQDDIKSITPEIDNVSGGEFTQTTTIEVNTILNNKSLEITTFETNTILDDLPTSTQETSLSNKFSEMTTDSINTSDISTENNLPQSSTISQKDDTFDRFTSTMKNNEEFTTEMYTSTIKLKVKLEDIITKSTVDVISTTKIESTTPKAENEPQITTLISKIENDNDVDGDGDQLENQSETNDKTNQDYEDFTNEASDNQEEHQTSVTTKINKKDPELFDTNNKVHKPTNNVDVSAEETTEESTTGETEENVEEELTVGTVAAIIIASVAVLCLVLLALLLVIMRKRQSRLTYGQRCTPVSLDAYSLDSVSIYNSVRRKGGVRASKRSYGNPAFEDSSTVTNPMNFAAMTNFVIDKEAIMKEFEDIPQVSVESNELPEGCESKNRYANVIPLPETKVILSLVEGDIHSDYINANFVRGPKNAKSYYIACQAPMEETIDDFWRMVWERQSRVILMLTELVENGIEKCANYLPPSEITDNNRQFGDYQITLKKREVRDKYIISCLLLKNMVSNCWREITHLWYIGWPERGVPEEANSIIAFLIEARSYLKVNLNSYQPNQNGQKLSENGYISDDVSGQGPVIVHCSPGTGRTGTIIACDIAIREFELLRLVDIPKTVYRIRRDRAGAVQTRDQYSFIYKVINLYATKLTGGAMESI